MQKKYEECSVSNTRRRGNQKSAVDNMKPLNGLLCLVEAFNDDGLDASAGTQQVLKDLGASISTELSESITHYVASNVSARRVAAAELMDVLVVSPLWAEQCREAKQLVAEADFHYISAAQRKNFQAWMHSFPAGSQFSAFGGFPAPPEPLPQRASLDRSVDSPFFSSSQRPFTMDSHVDQSNATGPAASGKVCDEAGIPLPSFREYIMPKVDASALKRRRSERISDLLDEEDDENMNEFKRYARKTSSKAPAHEQEELTAVMAIAPEDELPVVVFEGQDQDTLPPPLSLQQQREQDKVLRERKVKKELHKHQQLLGNSLSSGKANIILSVPLSSKITTTSSNDRNIECCEDRGVEKPASSVYSPALASSGTRVSIAITGFGNKEGDKSTLSMMLHQLMHQIERSPDSSTEMNSVSEAGSVKRGRGRPPRAPKPSPEPLPQESADCVQKGYIAQKEKSIALLENSEDYSSESCTHVIVSKNSMARTLRVLFAMARGLCIMTDDWVYDSVSKESWSDPRRFPHPRFKNNFERSNAVLSPEITICILESRNPSLDTLRELVTAAGGTVASAIHDHDLSFIMFGDSKDANEYVSKKLRRKKVICDDDDMMKLRAMAEKRQVVTAKFLFNCIEEQMQRKPKTATSAGEIINTSDLSRSNKFQELTADYLKTLKQNSVNSGKNTNRKASRSSPARSAVHGSRSKGMRIRRGPGRPRKTPLSGDSQSTSASVSNDTTPAQPSNSGSNTYEGTKVALAESLSQSGDGVANTVAAAEEESAKKKGTPGRKKKVPLSEVEIVALYEQRQQEREHRLAAAKATPSDRDLRAAKRQQLDVEKLVVNELPRKLHGNCKLDGKRVGRKGTASSSGTPSISGGSLQEHSSTNKDRICPSSAGNKNDTVPEEAFSEWTNNTPVNNASSPQLLAGNRWSTSGRRSSGVATVIDEPLNNSNDTSPTIEEEVKDDQDEVFCNNSNAKGHTTRTSNTQVAINSLLLLSNGKENLPEDGRRMEHISVIQEFSSSPLIERRKANDVSNNLIQKKLESTEKDRVVTNNKKRDEQKKNAALERKGKKRKSRSFKDPYAEDEAIESARVSKNTETETVKINDQSPLSIVHSSDEEIAIQRNRSSKGNSSHDSRTKDARTSLSSVEAAAVDEILGDSDEDSVRMTSLMQSHHNRRAKMRRTSGNHPTSAPSLKLVNSTRSEVISTASNDPKKMLTSRTNGVGGLLSKNRRATNSADSEDDIHFSQ